VTNVKNKRKTNGHAEPQDRTNGHCAASTQRGGIALHGALATPDDASGASLANAAISANAAGKTNSTHADATTTSAPEKNTTSSDSATASVHFPGPTDSEAMQDAGAYVNAVAERVDLVAASVRLVQATDEKIAKSELDRLREMKFGKVGPAVVDEQVYPELGDLPRPRR